MRVAGFLFRIGIRTVRCRRMRRSCVTVARTTHTSIVAHSRCGRCDVTANPQPVRERMRSGMSQQSQNTPDKQQEKTHTGHQMWTRLRMELPDDQPQPITGPTDTGARARNQPVDVQDPRLILNRLRCGTERPPGCFGIFRDFQSTSSVGNPHFPQPCVRITQQKRRFPKSLAQTSLLSMR